MASQLCFGPIAGTRALSPVGAEFAGNMKESVQLGGPDRRSLIAVLASGLERGRAEP